MRNSPFRYPGGKYKISDQIIDKIPHNSIEYREPFFGAGSVGLEVLKRGLFEKYWFNDVDRALIALWITIYKYPYEIIEMIEDYKPKVDDFYIFKDQLKKDNFFSYTELGFKKLVLHQISYSGLGMKAGGPIGGEGQNSNYKVDCRWSSKRLIKKIIDLNKLLNSSDVQFTCLDYTHLLEGENCSIYLDPPYFSQGSQLYQFGFEGQHLQMRDLLKTKKNWLLSYDNCNEIREMYNWAEIQEVPIKYSINGIQNKSELLINARN